MLLIDAATETLQSMDRLIIQVTIIAFFYFLEKIFQRNSILFPYFEKTVSLSKVSIIKPLPLGFRF